VEGDRLIIPVNSSMQPEKPVRQHAPVRRTAARKTRTNSGLVARSSAQ